MMMMMTLVVSITIDRKTMQDGGRVTNDRTKIVPRNLLCQVICHWCIFCSFTIILLLLMMMMMMRGKTFISNRTPSSTSFIATTGTKILSHVTRDTARAILFQMVSVVVVVVVIMNKLYQTTGISIRTNPTP